MEKAVLDATICDYVDQGVIATNGHLKIIFINRWIETFTGHRLEDVAGRSIEEVFPELKRNNKLSYYSIALQGNHVVISHHVNRNFFLFPSVVEHEAIDYMIQNVKIFPIIQESGIGGTLTIIQDATQDFLRNCQLEKVITDLKKAQKHLTESQELYKILINTISDILVIVDSSGKIHFISPAVERLSDFNIDDIIGTHWIDWVHPDDVVRVKEMFNALAEGNFGGQGGHESVRVEVRLKVAKERWHYFEAAGGNVRHGEDSENRIVISLRDVEKRKELEKRLKHEQTFLKTILNTVSALIVVLDPEGHILLFNKACQEVTGYSFDEVVGRKIFDFLIPDDQKDLAKGVFSDSINQALPNAYEGYWITKDGDKRLILWSNAVVLGGDGKPEYVISTGIDTTEQRELEESLVASRKQLIAQVQELEEKNVIFETINQLNLTLMAANAEEEIFRGFQIFAPKIFQETDGTLMRLLEDVRTLKPVAVWGEGLDECQFLNAQECWALRTGKVVQCGFQSECLCSYLKKLVGQGYFGVCSPVIAGSKHFGVLTVRFHHLQGALNSSYRRQEKFLSSVVSIVSLMVGSALSNVSLRDQLKDMSIRDPLTGLFNRRFMQETINREWHRATRENRPLSIVMFDIDRFKQFNDHYGHVAGDSLLQYLGTFLKKSIRASDIPFRYGGEEFLIILPGADVDVAAIRADSLRRSFSRTLIPIEGRYIEGITFSAGVAAYPHGGKSPDEVIKLADGALYEAKKQGRNRVVKAVSRKGRIVFEVVSDTEVEEKTHGTVNNEHSTPPPPLAANKIQ